MSWKEIHGAEQKPQGPQTFLDGLQRYSAVFLYFTVKLGSVARAKARGDQENLKGKQTSHRPSQGDESRPHSLMSCLTRQTSEKYCPAEFMEGIVWIWLLLSDNDLYRKHFQRKH